MNQGVLDILGTRFLNISQAASIQAIRYRESESGWSAVPLFGRLSPDPGAMLLEVIPRVLTDLRTITTCTKRLLAISIWHHVV